MAVIKTTWLTWLGGAQYAIPLNCKPINRASLERDKDNRAHGTHMTPRQSGQTAGQSLPDSLRNCLSLDIEVSRQSGQTSSAGPWRNWGFR